MLVFPLWRRHLAAPCFLLRGRKPTLPSLNRQPISLNSSPALTCRQPNGFVPEHAARLCNFQSRLQGRAAFYIKARETVNLFLRSLLFEQLARSPSPGRCPEAAVRRGARFLSPGQESVKGFHAAPRRTSAIA